MRFLHNVLEERSECTIRTFLQNSHLKHPTPLTNSCSLNVWPGFVHFLELEDSAKGAAFPGIRAHSHWSEAHHHACYGNVFPNLPPDCIIF